MAEESRTRDPVRAGAELRGAGEPEAQASIYGADAIRFRWFNQPSEALKAVGLEK
jgi:hypothetical protein